MCGIAGIVRRGSGALSGSDDRILARMLAALEHRGPDDQGTWRSADGRVLLGHARLAIVDLSPAGHEPITSADGRVTLTFNGEVFNHGDLRATLPEGRRFRGHCDAETLVEVLAARGESVVEELHGFFAFAAAMPHGGVLLARDRLGEKPLYYVHDGTRTLFASELRALLASGVVERHIDPLALALYVAVGSVPAPWTIVSGIRALPPAHVLTVTQAGPSEPTAWWVPPVPSRSAGLLAPEEVTDQAEALLRSSIADRLLADVPVGAFLSGGVDSPLVVALMQEATGRPVRTFTVGFEQAGSVPDERSAARAVADALGSDHCERVITGQELPDVAERFFGALDQPSGDALNSFLASEAVGTAATAVLSGVGADELFYGYAFARRAARWRRVGAVARRSPISVRTRAVSAVGGAQRLGALGRGARALTALGSPELVRLLLTHDERDALGVRGGAPEAWLSEGSTGTDPGRQVDLRVFLQTVLLPDLDAMTMAHSLEARAPFLDHRLVEWSLRLPPDACWSDGAGKAPLRKLAARHVPNISGRPKLGFDLPLGTWMAGPLRTVTDDLVRSATARGVLDGATLDRLVTEVRSGRRHPRSVWHLLVLEAWMDRHLPDSAG